MASVQNHETLEGQLEHVTFHSPESGFSVVKLKVPGRSELVMATGALAGVHVGETIRCTGAWAVHPRFGQQFRIASYETLVPATAAGLQRYLASGLIRGVGPVTARRMIECFGTEIVRVIEEEPERLCEVPRMGRRKIEQIRAAWAKHKEIQNVMVFLQGHGITPAFAVKIYKQYSNASIATVQDNPYQLADDIWGIGFKTADKIARALGLPADSPARIRAGITHTVSKFTDQGHVFAFEEDLLVAAAELLAVEIEQTASGLEAQIADRKLVAEKILPAVEGNSVARNAIYLPSLHAAEHALARRIAEIARFRPAVTVPAAEGALQAVTARQEVPLSPEQLDAVRTALTSGILVLTGGPGTGKSTTCNTILAAFEELGRTVVLASPTGRAAKRLTELTGRPARTIHRLLEFDPQTMGFKRGPDSQLAGDVFVFDEVSMLDLVLANSVVRALPAGAQLLLVGDCDQLPSVGPGSVLRDLLASGAVPSCRLTRIFRQAQGSLIVTNAHRINRGEFPLLLPPTAAHRQENAFFLEEVEPEGIVRTILDLVTRRLPARGYSQGDLQVLCPMNRGSAGAAALNVALQQAVNPSRPGDAIAPGPARLRSGDRVIQLKNNYQQEVYNGDVGSIVSVDLEEQRLEVAYPDKTVEYDFADTDELALAYALSVHKAQGSEYPVVIVPLTTQHFPMLQRNLLYTAITRARRLLILVGSQKATAIAVKNGRMLDRNTQLADLLAKNRARDLP